MANVRATIRRMKQKNLYHQGFKKGHNDRIDGEDQEFYEAGAQAAAEKKDEGASYEDFLAEWQEKHADEVDLMDAPDLETELSDDANFDEADEDEADYDGEASDEDWA